MLTLSHFSKEIDAVVALVRGGQVREALAASEELVQRFCDDSSSEGFWRYNLLRIQVLAYLGHAKRGEALLERELAGEPLTTELAVAVRIMRGSSYCRRALYRPAKDTLDDAVEIASHGNFRALEAEANVRRGFLYYQLERTTESEGYYRRALEIGQSLGNRYLEAIAMAGVAKNIMRSGKHQAATDCFLAIRQTADEIGERLFSAMLACEIAWGYMNQANYVPALNYLLEAEPVLRDAGVMQLYGICEADVGYIYLRWGSYEVAISYFRRALEIAVEAGDVVSQRKWSHNLAIAYGKLGDDANSQSFAEVAAQRVTYLNARRMEVD